MDENNYLDLIEHLSLKKKNDLKNFLIKKRSEKGLNFCRLWLRKNITSIDQGKKQKLNYTPDELLDAELQRLSEETDIALKKAKKSKETIKYSNPKLSIQEKFEKDLGWGYSNEEMKAINDLIDCKAYVRSNIDYDSNNKPGNPDFKDSSVKVPAGFYDRAEELIVQNQDDKGNWKQGKSNNWLFIQLDAEFFNGDEKKKATIRRWLKEKSYV